MKVRYMTKDELVAKYGDRVRYVQDVTAVILADILIQIPNHKLGTEIDITDRGDTFQLKPYEVIEG